LEPAVNAAPAKGLSIHIGLNSVDPAQYEGWNGQLVACEFDATDMAQLAASQGFETTTLLTKDATAAAVTSAIKDAGSKLGTGDILCLYYSGHGGQVPDANSDEDERLDETWVLYDRQLVDDELYTLWSAFTPGVRVLVMSDSCHSGTLLKLMPKEAAAKVGVSKALPPEVEDAVYAAHRELYDQIQAGTTAYDKAPISASALLVSACQDNQTASDALEGQRNSLFTAVLLTVWAQGQFAGNYRELCTAIGEQTPSQQPNFFTAGAADPAFEAQRPFTI
jgi:metacaspase-1